MYVLKCQSIMIYIDQFTRWSFIDYSLTENAYIQYAFELELAFCFKCFCTVSVRTLYTYVVALTTVPEPARAFKTKSSGRDFSDFF